MSPEIAKCALEVAVEGGGVAEEGTGLLLVKNHCVRGVQKYIALEVLLVLISSSHLLVTKT